MINRKTWNQMETGQNCQKIQTSKKGQIIYQIRLFRRQEYECVVELDFPTIKTGKIGG